MNSPLLAFEYRSRLVEVPTRRDMMRLMKQVRKWTLDTGVVVNVNIDGCDIHEHIEGPEDAVLATVARLICDPRHASFHILRCERISHYSLTSWSFRFDSCVTEIPLDLDDGRTGFGTVVPLRR
ncbi:BLUF domain-containing protein [Oceanomicrobium pacificus]|uniref:BLUF domain-containing protein n=1 Tax=Oceanomicrobium pacificus TaxID=2692916 RepID=A0A6B0TUE7_9RHOB|nr:BLUF domain-containing protein [Oceanomicrobium pacificus]MXU66409.1 hypothetical protein [Oceanomicrobium pacificus]